MQLLRVEKDKTCSHRVCTTVKGVCSVYVLCMFCVCSVYVLCMFCVCFVYVLCMFCVCMVNYICSPIKVSTMFSKILIIYE